VVCLAGAAVISAPAPFSRRLALPLPCTLRRAPIPPRVGPSASHPRGTILASGGLGRTIKLWDLKTGRCSGTASRGGHNGGPSISPSPSAPTATPLASAGQYEIRLWDVKRASKPPRSKTPRLSRRWPSAPTARSWPHRGSLDFTIKLWDAKTHKRLLTLIGHTIGVNSVAFSPDGKALASGSIDDTVKLWDVASGKPRSPSRGHTRSVTSVAFSPDGKTFGLGQRR